MRHQVFKGRLANDSISRCCFRALVLATWARVIKILSIMRKCYSDDIFANEILMYYEHARKYSIIFNTI